MQLLADIPSDGFGIVKDKWGEHQTCQERQSSLARLPWFLESFKEKGGQNYTIP